QAVLGYAGDRYNIETQAMTKDQLRDELARIGIDGAAAVRVIGIVEQCEIARFSPGLLADQDPRRLFEQAKTILSEL
ncbi:MAG TPA: hypothetical protein VMF29_00865, partial [Candidatus Edwardsbacteria bacterium]|nr:hypothetical protein [Candidatus Edwardsbacteria bacterium]